MDRETLLRRVTQASVSIAFFLVAIKLVAWVFSDSVSILSSLSDSLSDFMISAMNFVAIRYALKPADDDHKFGHGKAEDLAALAQGIFITALSVFVIIEAVEHIINPKIIAYSTLSIVVMIISLALTIGLVLFQKYVHRKTGSNLVHADALHYLGDILSNIAIIASLALASIYSVKYLDPILGILIAVYLIYSAWHVGASAFDNLMDKEIETENVEKIKNIITSHPKVTSLTSLLTRYSGSQPIIQFDFTMDGSATLAEAHDVAHEIEMCLLGEFPDALIFMHQEPDEN